MVYSIKNPFLLRFFIKKTNLTEYNVECLLTCDYDNCNDSMDKMKAREDITICALKNPKNHSMNFFLSAILSMIIVLIY